MTGEMFKSIEDVLIQIKEDLRKKFRKKVFLLYAYNASGKTRLSQLFHEKYERQVLSYNAFFEDLFSWNNENYVLKMGLNPSILDTMQAQGIDQQIVNHFKEFTGGKIEPVPDVSWRSTTFNIYESGDGPIGPVKISRGEESVFIWSFFYTILEAAIDALNDPIEDRTTDYFDEIKYVVIDDPVSSMDDARIITVALALADLIERLNPQNQLKFLITTHHALFFNVLFNFRFKRWRKRAYILSKLDKKFDLEAQANDSPFAYHHIIIAEIQKAIKNNDIKRYHFNLFRALLEKTANFLGRPGGWKKILPTIKSASALKQTLNHYSHSSLSDLEPSSLSEADKDDFETAFEDFLKKYNWNEK